MHLSDKQKGFKWIVLAKTDWGKEYPKVNLAMGVDVAKPGEYKTACGKGYFACAEGEPAILRLNRPAIDYFKFGVPIPSSFGTKKSTASRESG